MSKLSKKRVLIASTLLHTLGYYLWIYCFKENDHLRTIGGDVFSFLGPFAASTILFFVYKRTSNQDKYFWFLMFLGCFSYVMAEAIWNYFEIFLTQEVPYPGWADLFYMLQIVFFLLAFLIKIWVQRDTLHLIKFIFDTCIIMTVSISFSWHFIINDILAQRHEFSLFTFVSVGYPVGDLILLLGAVSFYIGSDYFFSKRVLYLMFASLIVQVSADSAYLYLSANSTYLSGGLIDPLWTVSNLLIALSGVYYLTDQSQNTNERVIRNRSRYIIKDIFSFRLLLPYLSVILLFLIMIFQRKEINSLIVGSAIAILLVILRQIFTLLENQTLLTKYHTLTEELELKIEKRTEEITNKNQQLMTAVQKMKHMAYHDVLSGLPNRRLFLEKLNAAMTGAQRKSGKLAVVFIDLDRFKNINDTLGHDFGDLLLKYVSNQMAVRLRKGDTVSRQGGDEFTILLNKIENEIEVLQLIKPIQSIIENAIRIKGQELHVSMSIGISIYPKDGTTTEELMKHADMAMYSAKEAGGNNIKFFSTKMNETISRKVILENGLRRAIANQEFILHYQPQVHIITGKVIGMETLIRWKTSDSSVISPGEFIPLAEETRLIIPIGEWVLFNACKQAKRWHDAGHRELKLAVNLSPLQFLHENAVEMIAKILKVTGFNPYYLEIEITEGVAVYDAEEAIIKMQALRDLGVRISIDDFGTGYSSLFYLKRFPINTLKIAQPFVKDIIKNASDKSLVHAIISMAHSLGLSVIAEGVETKAQLETLMDLECDDVQGYLYSKPLPTEQFSKLLEKGYLPIGSGSPAETEMIEQ